MLNCTRWLKVGYFLTLATALVLLVWKPAPIQAQRTIAYPFLPGAWTNASAMAAVAAQNTVLTEFTQTQAMLAQAGQALDAFGVGQSGANPVQGYLGGSAGAAGLGGGGFGGNRGGGGFGGGFQGGGFGGMGGFGGNRGGGGFGGGGMGGMGGFAGKGFGGFNGKKAL